MVEKALNRSSVPWDFSMWSAHGDYYPIGNLVTAGTVRIDRYCPIAGEMIALEKLGRYSSIF